MGWDVVQIGLKHDLPVEDPIATAQEVAKRLKRNIHLVYRDEYNYDAVNNIVSSANYDLVETGKYKETNFLRASKRNIVLPTLWF